jgi:hypothetical protein
LLPAIGEKGEIKGGEQSDSGAAPLKSRSFKYRRQVEPSATQFLGWREIQAREVGIIGTGGMPQYPWVG